MLTSDSSSHGPAGAGDRKRSTKVTQDDVLIGHRVRIRRVELGLTQESLSTSIGVGFQQLQKYEGGTNRISAVRLFHIAKVLQVPVSYFFEDFDEAIPESHEGELVGILQTQLGIEMLKAFAKLTPPVRRRLVDLARSITEEDAQ